MRNRQATKLLFELSEPGRRAAMYPASDVPVRPLNELLPAAQLTAQPDDLRVTAELIDGKVKPLFPRIG